MTQASFDPFSYHDPSASLEEGLQTLRRCIDEVAKRVVVGTDKYIVKIIDKDGARTVQLPPSIPIA
jgi:20S proteasome alpha/beta subunit